jgi:hypothetical protein
VKLIAHLRVGLKLVCAYKGNARAIDQHFNDQTLIRLRDVQRPTLQHIAVQASDCTAKGGRGLKLADGGWLRYDFF